MRSTASIAAFTAGLLFLATLPADAGGPRFRDKGDNLVLENDHIVVEFQGKKPMLHVRDATNESRSFKVFLQDLVELDATATGGSGVAARFRMGAAADWEVEHTEDADGITLKLHREAALDVAPPPPLVQLPPRLGNVSNPVAPNETHNASVTLVFHLRSEAATAQGNASAAGANATGNATYGNGTSSAGAGANVTADPNAATATGVFDVKFDLVVEQWEWVDDKDSVALDFLVTTGGEDGAAGSSGNGTGNATGEATREGDAVKVGSQGQALGFVSWAGTANATTNGTASPVDVRYAEPTGDEADEGEGGSRHRLVYDAPGFERLEHDPSVGVEPAPPSAGVDLGAGAGGDAAIDRTGTNATGDAGLKGTSSTPGFGVATAAAALGVMALLADRRRRRA